MKAPALVLDVLPGRLALCRLAGDVATPAWVADARRFLTISRTPDELSIVADAEVVPPGASVISDFCALRIRGPVPLDTVGVLAALVVPLAGAGIPVFPIGTHDTDYLLLRESNLAAARGVLERAGHRILP